MLNWGTAGKIQMEFARRSYDKISPNLDSMRQQFDDALACLLRNYIPNDTEQTVGPDQLADSMKQFFNILASIDHTDTNDVNRSDLDDLANHGLRLLQELCDWSQKLDCDESFYKFQQLSLPVAVWGAQHHLQLTDIEIIVDAISHIANNTQDTRYLSKLAEIIDNIIEQISPAIKRDHDKSNPGRPWRVLNLNHAIIATRCLDPKRMEAVFEQLIYRLPDDAPGFFAEGMQQMDIIGYPQHVRTVMKTYYQLTNQPTLH